MSHIFGHESQYYLLIHAFATQLWHKTSTSWARDRFGDQYQGELSQLKGMDMMQVLQDLCKI